MGGPGSNRWTKSPRGRRRVALLAELAVTAVVAALLPAIVSTGSPAAAATSCPAAGCARHHRRPRLPDREAAGELHLHRQPRQHEAAERPARR